MRDSQIERFASVLTEYSLEVKPGDLVMISGSLLAEPLIRMVHRQTLALGGVPVVNVSLPGLQEQLLAEGNDNQLSTVTPIERIGTEQADAYLRIGAPENTRAKTGINPDRERMYSRARSDLHQQFLDRAASGALRWSLTVFPTQALAQEAEMSLIEYEAFVASACWLDDPDPVARWREIADRQSKLIERLTPAREVHIIAPDTDLRLSIEGRTWINSDGHRNFPSGEVFTGPIEDSAEGHIRFSYPMVIQGREIEDIQLWFEAGRVVRASATKNQDFLEAMLETDDGARYLGEFAFGTNDNITRFTRNTLFDEKIGGTIHMAIGSGYPDTGSTNKSAIHWDLIRDIRQGGEIYLDGELFMKDGKYLVD